jgi:hypothetical protein
MSVGIGVLLFLSALIMLAAGALTGSRGGWNTSNSMASAFGILVAVVLVGAASYFS